MLVGAEFHCTGWAIDHWVISRERYQSTPDIIHSEFQRSSLLVVVLFEGLPRQITQANGKFILFLRNYQSIKHHDSPGSLDKLWL